MIRESCRTSETLNQLSAEAERLFWRLTTVADDYGRFEADPRVLLAQCFPLQVGMLKVKAVGRWFQELVTCGLVTTYDGGGKQLGFFTTWDKHQRIRAQHSKYPPPSSDNICQQTTADVPVVVVEVTEETEDTERRRRGVATHVAWPHPAALIDLYNTKAPDECGSVMTLSPKRLEAARKLLVSFPEQTWWEEVFEQMRASQFLRGLVPPRDGSKKSFLADFDWLLATGKGGTENCVLVHDGRYLDG